MNAHLQFDFTVDKNDNTIRVTREFAANRDLVWETWTNPEILDQWLAPKPYKAETLSMDFRAGGHWFYCMVGPDGDRHYCRADYGDVQPKEFYTAADGFTDENGKLNPEFPQSNWRNTFREADQHTVVEVLISYASLTDLEAVISMGFKEGYTMALENLDQYIEARGRLRNELRTDNQARVTTYLNFPGNTEEAFLFYRSVFRSEFSGGGIQRFAQAPQAPDQPPMSESLKNMVLHVELPILGGHVLMATDAPEEMGFTVATGNNMHISLEPDSKEEAERLFNELSVGGNITMPLQDMFWGAYFGSFTDRFGINWMVNFRTS